MTTCAICFYVREEPNEVDVIINGNGVCEDHADYVVGGNFAGAVIAAKNTEGVS